jgi:hypothetical protein
MVLGQWYCQPSANHHVHPMKGLDESLLKELQNAPADEFGVTHLNILYNQKKKENGQLQSMKLFYLALITKMLEYTYDPDLKKAYSCYIAITVFNYETVRS